jgi:hypothetical protein
MRKVKFFLKGAGLGLFACLCGAWGFLGHRTINQLAIYQLPGEMRSFFYANRNYLVRESVGPDLRRNTDSLEAPRHFIDLELYGDSAAWKMPLHWQDAVKAYGLDTLRKYGYVPYEVIMMKDLLTGAFRMKNKDSILFYAADLGHYIGDAHVPLHATANYDGQLSHQKGIHSLWESQVPDLELESYDLFNGHESTYLSDPSTAIWAVIRESHAMVDNLLSQEKEASLGFPDTVKFKTEIRNGRTYKTYTEAFARKYAERLGRTVNQRLLAAGNLVADFWFTSWVDAGKPDLRGLLDAGSADAQKESLEYREYRQNRLLRDHLLIAREPHED